MSENSRARIRLLERHGTAAIRAQSSAVDAEYRGRRLRVDGRPVPFASPHLAIDFSTASLAQSRGVADALAARLTHCDLLLHASHSPAAPMARVVFDILEQLRCEGLVSRNLTGARKNLDVAFSRWCQQARVDGMPESAIGILLYTLIHMVRARLINNTDDEEVDALIEATRASLSPLIGVPFYALKKNLADQAAYAKHAIQIADIIARMAGDEIDDSSDAETALAKHAIVLAPDWDGQDIDSASDGDGGIAGNAAAISESGLDNAGDYCVFTRDYDQVVTGDSLYRKSQLQTLRRDLDRQIASQAVSINRLARRLQLLFSAWSVDGWIFGQDEGALDGRRLTQLIANPDYKQVFCKDRLQPVNDTVVSFLIDNSGSMKAQRYESVAVLVDTYARALEMAGASCEVLGFTTADWNGGRVVRDWRRAGMPAAPGRLNETLHIVYKDADEPWKRARLSMAGMLQTYHFREGVDGEALIWAYRRLQKRSEKRRILVVISDGAPLDAATHNANREGFLSDHLLSVAKFIDQQPDIEVGAIGIDLDVADIYRRSLMLDLEGTLNSRTYGALETLFADR